MRRIYELLSGKVLENLYGQGQITVFIRPEEAERRYLIDEMKIDEHTLYSALDPDELARLEIESNHAAIILKCPRATTQDIVNQFEICSIGMFLFKDQLIIVADHDIPVFDGGKHFLKCHSLNDVAIKSIYKTISLFLTQLRSINRQASDIESKLHGAIENEQLMHLFELEKVLVYYVNAIHSNSIMLDKVRNNTVKLGFTVEQGELLEDVSVENSQCAKQAEIYSSILAGLMDARVSIISNNLNIIMKTLTLITLGIMVPTFVVSAFSMNVHLPFGLNESPLSFWIITSLAFASVFVLVILQKKKKW